MRTRSVEKSICRYIYVLYWRTCTHTRLLVCLLACFIVRHACSYYIPHSTANTQRATPKSVYIYKIYFTFYTRSGVCSLFNTLLVSGVVVEMFFLWSRSRSSSSSSPCSKLNTTDKHALLRVCVWVSLNVYFVFYDDDDDGIALKACVYNLVRKKPRNFMPKMWQLWKAWNIFILDIWMGLCLLITAPYANVKWHGILVADWMTQKKRDKQQTHSMWKINRSNCVT